LNDAVDLASGVLSWRVLMLQDTQLISFEGRMADDSSAVVGGAGFQA
jgi:hypothetical protein